VVRCAVYPNTASSAFRWRLHTLDKERQGTFLPSGLSFSLKQATLGFFVRLSALEHSLVNSKSETFLFRSSNFRNQLAHDLKAGLTAVVPFFWRWMRQN
jgi:hypothetical protein